MQLLLQPFALLYAHCGLYVTHTDKSRKHVFEGSSSVEDRFQILGWIRKHTNCTWHIFLGQTRCFPGVVNSTAVKVCEGTVRVL